MHFPKEPAPIYRPIDRSSRPLFLELFPFGGKFAAGNRWLRIAELIPWQVLEDEYRKAFSNIGRPAKDAQLVIGLLMLKHMTGLSDRELVAEALENPYMQVFCGFRSIATEEVLDSSTLANIRGKLGLSFFRYMEEKTYEVLIERRIIRAGDVDGRHGFPGVGQVSDRRVVFSSGVDGQALNTRAMSTTANRARHQFSGGFFTIGCDRTGCLFS